jgi:SAM-dependent methyltransferase
MATGWTLSPGPKGHLLKHARVFLAYLPKIVTFRAHRVRGYLFRSRLIREYLATSTTPRLHIGAAKNAMPGWLDTDLRPRRRDVLYLDVTEPFPFGGATFDYVFSEHLIEHIAYEEGRFMLSECFRVLKPGGTIRIATPDLERLMALVSPEKGEPEKAYIAWITDRFIPGAVSRRGAIVVNNAFYGFDHRFLYDRETLAGLLEEVGFRDTGYHVPGESGDEHLRGIEAHGRSVNNAEMMRFETMVIEAARPQ